MMSRIKRAVLEKLVRRSKTATIACGVYSSWKAGRSFRKGNNLSTSGSTHLNLTVSQSVDYVNEVYRDYLAYAGLSPDDLRGKRVLEVGPGDNLGVALRFLAAGAARVVCIDKFFSNRNPEQQREIYRALRAQLPCEERARYDESIETGGSVRVNPEKLLYIHGTAVEEARRSLSGDVFDFVVSRAVIEHLYDTDAAFSVMDSLLAPGGYMIHKIDLGDHGMFTRGGHHPLTFLTIPDMLYSLMTKHSGSPNRRTVGYYHHKMRELGYDAKVLITRIIGSDDEIVPHEETAEVMGKHSSQAVPLVSAIRPRLQPAFRRMADEELAVTGIFLTGRKRW